MNNTVRVTVTIEMEFEGGDLPPIVPTKNAQQVGWACDVMGRFAGAIQVGRPTGKIQLLQVVSKLAESIDYSMGLKGMQVLPGFEGMTGDDK
jgi:hypothetical protein